MKKSKMPTPQLRKILVAEDVYGRTYEFHLFLPEETWRDRMKLSELAMNLVHDTTDKEPQLVTIHVLSIN
jgi:hypothetical protein